MTFSIVGTGNIAWFLGKRLSSSGHQCKGVFGRNAKAVKELSDALLSGKHGELSDIEDELADVCFLAVSDNAVEAVSTNIHFKKTVLVHMAGALSLDSIKKAAKDHAVLWPIYSIIRTNMRSERDIPMAWEASSDVAKKYLLEIAHALTDNLFEAKEDQRKWLHLSAVITNNFINHLFTINEQICRDNKLPANTLQPLIKQTFDRVKTASPFTVQTGPAIRNDFATIDRHRKLLDQQPHLLKVYEALTESIKKVHGGG